MSKDNNVLLDAIVSFENFKKAFFEYSTLVCKGVVPDELIADTEYEHKLCGKTGKLTLILRGKYILCIYDPEIEGEYNLSWHYNLRHPSDWEDTIFYLWPYPDSDTTATYTNMPHWDCYDPGEAGSIEHYAGICEEKILELSQLPEFRNHKDTLANLVRLLRNDQAKWVPSRIKWEYIKTIDDCIKNLKLLGIEIGQQDPTPAQESNHENKEAKLTDTEQNILEVLGNNTLKGEELLGEVGYDYSSHYKTILSNLVKRGILTNIHK